MKNLTYIVLLLIGLSANAQRNVGINTDNPSQTLDIEGSLRVQSIPNGNKSTIPLSWNPDTETNNPGKIIAGTDDNNKPFKILRYRMTVGQKAEDYINDYNLGYSTEDYTIILLDHVLLDPRGYPVLMQVQGTKNGIETSPMYNNWGTNRGHVVTTSDNTPVDNGNMITMNDKSLVVSAPIIMTYPKGGTWHFYADYPSSAPVTFRYDTNSVNSLKVKEGTGNLPSVDRNVNFIWDVTFLLMKKTYAPHEKKNINY